MTDLDLSAAEVTKLALIYTENAKVAATFWEWRHKLMERFVVVVGGLVAGEAWLYHEKSLQRWLFLPLILAAVLSFIFFMMDRVNYKILRACYSVGKNIEGKLSDIPGIYTGLERRLTRINYSVMLRILYLTSTVVFLGSGLYVLFKQW